MDVTTVSSDDVLASYRRQLSDAHERIAILEAQITKLQKAMQDRERVAQVIREDLDK